MQAAREILRCVEIVVHAIQHRDASGPRRQNALGHGGLKIGAVGAVPALHRMKQVVAAQQQAFNACVGNGERMEKGARAFDHRPERRVPCLAPYRRYFVRARNLGSRMAQATDLAASRSSPCQGVPAALIRITVSRGAKPAHGSHGPGAGVVFFLRRNRVFQVQDDDVGGKAARLLQRARIRRRNEQRGAPGSYAPSTSRNSPSLTVWRILRAAVYSGEL